MNVAAAALAVSLALAPEASPEPPDPGLQELSLDDALAELDAQNLTIAEARARAGEAAGVARQAAAPLLPTLVAAGSYTRNNVGLSVGLGAFLAGLPLPPGSTPPPPILLQPAQVWAATGALRVPLVAPQAWFDLAAARGGARAAEASARASRLAVRAAFASAAYSALGIEELVRASEEAVASATELARSAERRAAAGTAPPLDVLRSQTEQVRRESELAAARAERSRARLALGTVLGRPGPVRVAVPEVVDAGAGAPTPALVEEALARRPELAARRAASAAAGALVRSAWARLAPQLVASGSAAVQDVPFPTNLKESWRAVVELSWTLYDGGFRYGKRQEADAALERARAEEEQEVLSVGQQVKDAVLDLDVARERLRLAVKQRQLAADAAGTARRSFAAGMASNLDVLDANDRLFESDVALATARARVAAARIGLSRAVGRDL